MDEPAVQAVIAALREAGKDLGEPAIEAAVRFVQVDATIGAMISICICVGCMLIIWKGVRLLKESSGDSMDDTARKAVGGVLIGVSSFIAVISLIVFGATLPRIIEPLGYIVSRAVGG